MIWNFSSDEIPGGKLTSKYLPGKKQNVVFTFLENHPLGTVIFPILTFAPFSIAISISKQWQHKHVNWCFKNPNKSFLNLLLLIYVE